MAVAVLRRFQTFFTEMTQNNDIKTIDDKNMDKIVAKIKAQETRNIGEMEKELDNIHIPLDDKKVEKVKVDEKKASRDAMEKVKEKQGTKKEMQRGE